MKALELLRAERARLEEQRTAAVEAIEATATAALTEERALTTDDDNAVATAQREIVSLDEQITALDEREAELVAIEERTKVIASRPALTVIAPPASSDVLNDRSATPQQLADAVTRSLEHRVESPENLDHVRKTVLRNRKDTAWARGILLRSSDVYEEAFSKLMTGREFALTAEERTALSSVTSANGGYLVPTHLDPTVILSNSGTSNAIRAMSRVVQLTAPGANVWHGITSAGVTASFDAVLAEVSDDSPTFSGPSISTHKAQALVQGSIESFEDIAGLAGEILMMFGDARDRLEGAAHATGSGSDQPKGIFTALDADTNVEILSDTAAAIYKADLDELYRSVPVRFRGNGKWLMNPIWAQAIQNLGTALSATYTTNLAEGSSALLYGKPVVESDDAPSSVTTTVRDNEIIFGDFSQYVIVDKPGSFAVELIPHLFNTSNNLPDGRRAYYAHWRTGADATVTTAFRLLQDKTSA